MEGKLNKSGGQEGWAGNGTTRLRRKCFKRRDVAKMGLDCSSFHVSMAPVLC